MRRSLPLTLTLAAAVLSGCAHARASRRTIQDGKVQVLTQEAEVRQTYFSNGALTICAEPVPDVALNRAIERSIRAKRKTSAKYMNIGVDKEGELEGDFSRSTTALALAGRNPTVLLTREFLYRLCEFTMNMESKKATKGGGNAPEAGGTDGEAHDGETDDGETGDEEAGNGKATTTNTSGNATGYGKLTEAEKRVLDSYDLIAKSILAQARSDELIAQAQLLKHLPEAREEFLGKLSDIETIRSYVSTKDGKGVEKDKLAAIAKDILSDGLVTTLGADSLSALADELLYLTPEQLRKLAAAVEREKKKPTAPSGGAGARAWRRGSGARRTRS